MLRKSEMILGAVVGYAICAGVGCESRDRQEHEVASTSSSGTEDSGTAPFVDTATWAGLLATHGPGIAVDVEPEEAKTIRFDPVSREFVVLFHFETLESRYGPIPRKSISGKRLAETLGAEEISSGVPAEFQMECGSNEGGEYRSGDLRFAVYRSGSCFHLRVFDATAEAVELFLGPQFVPSIEACQGYEIGTACRTVERLRVKIAPVPGEARAAGVDMEAVDGWLQTTEPSLLKATHVGFAAEGVRCELPLPVLSSPPECGLTGETYEPDECASKYQCKFDGKCGSVDGKCVPTTEVHCRMSQRCQETGGCSVVEQACRPTRQEHCTESELCREMGACTLSGDWCVATKASCEASEYCSDIGRCGVRDGKCVPTSSVHCKRSKDCAEHGRCKLINGSCRKP